MNLYENSVNLKLNKLLISCTSGTFDIGLLAVMGNKPISNVAYKLHPRFRNKQFIELQINCFHKGSCNMLYITSMACCP